MTYNKKYTLHNGKEIYVQYNEHNTCQITKECLEMLLDLHQQGRTEAIEDVRRAMYHQCFECDNDEDMQKWDSGNWFRYKLFENVIEQLKEQDK